MRSDMRSVPSICSSLNLRMAARMSFLSSYSVLLRNCKHKSTKQQTKLIINVALKKEKVEIFDI